MSSMVESLLVGMQEQYNALNTILQQYGIKIYLYGVRIKSDVCPTCVEYITVVEFSNKDLYDLFVNDLKTRMEVKQSEPEE
ncbi:MAG: hypothetical protein QXO72_05140 [Sulfolobales archaeon]